MYAPFFRSFYCSFFDDQRSFSFLLFLCILKISKANAKIEKLNSNVDINLVERQKENIILYDRIKTIKWTRSFSKKTICDAKLRFKKIKWCAELRTLKLNSCKVLKVIFSGSQHAHTLKKQTLKKNELYEYVEIQFACILLEQKL